MHQAGGIIVAKYRMEKKQRKSGWCRGVGLMNGKATAVDGVRGLGIG